MSAKKTHAMTYRGVRAPRSLKKITYSPKATHVALAVLSLFYFLVYFAAPRELPYQVLQRLVGLASALLAMLVVLFADAEFGSGALGRSAKGQSAVRPAYLLAGAVFVLTLLWWFSPWAPIKFIPPA